MLQPIAPMRKYGLRRPSAGSTCGRTARLNGWITSPVIGPARFRIGRSCGSAPR